MEYGKPIFGKVESSTPQVMTKYGPVIGENRQGIAIFRGIPYGEGCSGAGRFLPAHAPAPWTQPRDATRNGPIAIQKGCSINGSHDLGDYFSGGRRELFGAEDEKQNEECLVLNVTTPGIDSRRRPVLVYIHGGGYVNGSGTLTLGSDTWAREEDLVIVGINHRLNVFGYLYLGHLDPAYAESGAAGIFDLILALQWVQDNIAAFGGDPERVTVMGESGGGGKVSSLLALPQARGLFHRAVVESGSMPVDNLSAQDAARKTDALMAELNITSPDELLTVPAGDLLKAASHFPWQPVAESLGLAPQKDGHVRAYEASRHVPLLVGSSEDEMAVLAADDVLTVSEKEILPKLRAAAEKGKIPLKPGAALDSLIKAIDSRPIGSEDAAHCYARLISLVSYLGIGSVFQAQAKAAQGGAPVYHYFITYDTPLPLKPAFSCAWHTADLPLKMRLVLYPQTEALSRQMAHSWAAFIRTGDPSTEELLWPCWTSADRETMVFGEKTAVERGPLDEIMALIDM